MTIRRPLTATMLVTIAAIIMLAVAVPIGFAYMAYTDNSGINITGSQMSIFVKDDGDDHLDRVELPGSEREYYKTGANFQLVVGTNLYDCSPITGYYYKYEGYKYNKVASGIYRPIGDAPEMTTYNYEVSTGTDEGGTYYIDTFGSEWRKTGTSSYELLRDHVYKGLFYTEESTGQWTPNETYWSYTGNIVTSAPGGSGELRVWVETQDLRTWMAIKKITLTIDDEQYSLLDQDVFVTNETMYSIELRNGTKPFQLEVVYESELFFDPSDITNFIKSKLMFVFNTKDPVLYTVCFVMNGHGDQLPNLFLRAGETIDEPVITNHSGYQLIRWYYQNENFQRVTWHMGDDGDEIEEDVILYAEWQAV